MARRVVAGLGLLLPSLLAGQAPARPAAPSRIDSAFTAFWAAATTAEAARAVGAVLASGVSFDDALERLGRGRTYGPERTGMVDGSNRTSDGITHYYTIDVPRTYTPMRRYQVRIQLHGAVMGRPDNQPRNTAEIGRLPGAEQIYVLPYGWDDAPWWSEDQLLNFVAIVDALKRVYNVDENRVVLTGVSDGGTGTFYVAMRETTPFASFLPLNSFLMVLGNRVIEDGRSFPNNLRNKPMFAVNGGLDTLYPAATVGLIMAHLRSTGVPIEFHPQPEAGHNTFWWPTVRDTFETFVAKHPRDPYPDTLTWETADTVHNRAHWLVINRLDARASGTATLPDVNVPTRPVERFAFGSRALFARSRPSGRVDVVRTGNTVVASTRGVGAFTLLLSPTEFDFRQPIRVVANGRTVFDGRVEPKLETLMKWAARDNDRTMLFAAELPITIGR